MEATGPGRIDFDAAVGTPPNEVGALLVPHNASSVNFAGSVDADSVVQTRRYDDHDLRGRRDHESGRLGIEVTQTA